MIGPMWRDLVEQLFPDATFTDGASHDVLARAGRRLGRPIPEQLTSLLTESDGVRGAHDAGLVWPAERIVTDNLWFRTAPELRDLFMPFDPLLFFADAGNGDQFALLVPPVGRPDVFVWDHENDSRTWVAADLGTYLRWRADGRLTRT